MILTSTSDKIRVKMGAAATTTNPDYYLTYADHTASSYSVDKYDGTLNGTSYVDICGSPASSTQRVVKFFSINNRDTIAQDITIEYYNGSTGRVIHVINLSVGDTLFYTDVDGFTTRTSAGVIKNVGITSTAYLSNFLFSEIKPINNSATVTLGSNIPLMAYIGMAPKVSSSITLMYIVTTAASSITWAEAAIFKVVDRTTFTPNNLSSGGLKLLGYANIAGVITGTGVKSTTISLTTNTQVGDILFAAVGNNASSTAVIRGTTQDNVQAGLYGTASFRPSTQQSLLQWQVASTIPWYVAYVN